MQRIRDVRNSRSCGVADVEHIGSVRKGPIVSTMSGPVSAAVSTAQGLLCRSQEDAEAECVATTEGW